MVPERPLTHAILEALADGEEHFIRDLAATFDVSAKKIADSGGHLVREAMRRATSAYTAPLKKGLPPSRRALDTAASPACPLRAIVHRSVREHGISCG